MDPRPLPYQGSIPNGQRDLNWGEFREFIGGQYAKSRVPVILSYAKRFGHLLQSRDLRKIELVAPTIRDNVIKSLIILSKFLGVSEEFKAELKGYGIKLSKPDAFSAFQRMYGNSLSDLSGWLSTVNPVLKPEEKVLLRFLKLSGLRKSEAFLSFNLIIKLSNQDKLNSYLNSDGILEHFRFKADFLRRTKNAFISIVPRELIAEIAGSKPVSDTALIKRLERRSLPCRIQELRDNFGTYMVSHGFIREEINMLQGRVGASIFKRCYWSPQIRELQSRVLKALGKMELEGGDIS